VSLWSTVGHILSPTLSSRKESNSRATFIFPRATFNYGTSLHVENVSCQPASAGLLNSALGFIPGRYGHRAAAIAGHRGTRATKKRARHIGYPRARFREIDCLFGGYE
jgi:hypothetical protein